MVNKYKDFKVKDLQKALKKLKSENSEPDEIKYVSHILRDKLRLNNNNKRLHEPSLDNNHGKCQMLNHAKYVEKNFWGYVVYFLQQFSRINCSLFPAEFRQNESIRFSMPPRSAVYYIF